MVTVDFYQKLARRLELYLLRLANYQLPMNGFDLILLLPIAPDSWDDKKTLLVSAKALATVPRWDATYEILSLLRQGLNDEEYLSIYNVDLIEPSAYIVQQVKRYVDRREDGEIDAPISLIGGVTNQTITAIKSTILEQLQIGGRYLAEPVYGHGEIIGVLTKIEPVQDDVWLRFDTVDGERTCTYTDLVGLKSLSVTS